jgi:hypothetical protein
MYRALGTFQHWSSITEDNEEDKIDSMTAVVTNDELEQQKPAYRPVI